MTDFLLNVAPYVGTAFFIVLCVIIFILILDLIIND